METYLSCSRKYRIKQRKNQNNNIEYYIQWKQLSWYGIFWIGEYEHFNTFISHKKAEEFMNLLIKIDNNNCELRQNIKDEFKINIKNRK
jgi:hypothetical protein